MTAVAVSPKYQVVIPKDVRHQISVTPGQKFEVVVFDGMIHLVPLVPIAKLRGFLKGLSTAVDREVDRL
jgi:AbrB family looped-hinge helix DNA binding protein